MDNGTMISMIYLMFMVFLLCWGVAELGQNAAAKRKFGPAFKCGGKVKHISGLNLPDSLVCKLVCLEDKLILTANGQEIILSVDKLVYVDILSKSEIKKQYVANPGGAIAGALMGGALGAALLGGPTQQRIRMTRKNLVITYLNGDTPAYIMFDATYQTPFAQKVVKQYKYLRKNPNLKIEL